MDERSSVASPDQIAGLRQYGEAADLGFRRVRALCGCGCGVLRYRSVWMEAEQELLRADHAVTLSPRPEGVVDANPTVPSFRRLTTHVPHGAGGANAPNVTVDPVVHRVDQRLGWKRRPLGRGLRVQRTQRPAPAARASPEQRSCFIEPLRRQKIERRTARGNLEEGRAVAAGVPAVGLPHDVEDLQQVLLVGGVHRLAAGPEVHAAPRHAEEPSDLVPGQSRRTAQFRDRIAREPGCIPGKPILVCEHGPVTIARRFEPAKEFRP